MRSQKLCDDHEIRRMLELYRRNDASFHLTQPSAIHLPLRFTRQTSSRSFIPTPSRLMRTSSASQTYVCLPCLLRNGVQSNTLPTTLSRRTFASTVEQGSSRSDVSASLLSSVKRRKNDASLSSPTRLVRRLNTSSPESDQLRLSSAQIANIGQYHHLGQKLKEGLSEVPEAKDNPDVVPIETLLAVVKSKTPGSTAAFVQNVEKVYAGQHYKDVQKDLAKVAQYRRPSMRQVSDESVINILSKLGVVDQGSKTKATSPSKKSADKAQQSKDSSASATTTTGKDGEPETSKHSRSAARKARLRKVKAPRWAKVPSLAIRKQKVKPGPVRAATKDPSLTPQSPARPSITKRASREVGPTVLRAPPDAKSLDGSLIKNSPIEKEATLPVPKLSFDLSRVLFNPGVYHLQDPRSRVYNFDPYLEKIMPVSEFNFEALNPYITSSQDHHLRDVSLKHNRRYIGSSSSMSGVMSHFHFLLSAWRPLDSSMLSKRIEANNRFTVITRAPSAVFLRWRDGVYAVDADKEHDSPNILMMQGKSMEKLLTLEKDDFEKYRKPKAGEQAPAIDSDPESYHYSACENFLLRSQLDAWDPRLPGTGMFDLKTRACAGIRMDMKNHEHGMGYQIKERFGEWESFDREYFDMMRSAFLKYSLQVRMGRMDGIFVAYHNIERIFGFQYISLAELDNGLHGQTDPCLGDREFKMTVSMMNEIFDLATKEFPKQSLRFVFETRDTTQARPNGYMRVFAEPMSEENIEKIQNQGKSKVAEYEKNLMMGIPNKPTEKANGQNMGGKSIESKISLSTLESNSGDVAFLEEIMRKDDDTILATTKTEDTSLGKVVGWEINVFNEVNGRPVIRPQRISSSDRWVANYTIEPIADAQVKGYYNMTQARRASALSFDMKESKDNYFIQRIRDMSHAGRAWREEQDEIDAQKEKVVLYNAGG